MSGNLATRYPQYYKDVSHLQSIDVYAVHKLFGVNDPSGALQHASKKLLLAGVRTGGKPAVKDIKEARDTLTRFLQMEAAKEAAAIDQAKADIKRLKQELVDIKARRAAIQLPLPSVKVRAYKRRLPLTR